MRSLSGSKKSGSDGQVYEYGGDIVAAAKIRAS